MVFQNDILAGASGTAAGYTINQSIRFNDDDTAYLTRTQDTGDSKRIATFSWWMKRGSNFGTESAVIAAGASSRFLVRFNTSNQLTLRLTNGTTEYTLTTNMVFRDPSAWYHCVWRIDVTQATAADRSQLYVNGSAVTFTGSSLPAQNTDVVGLADATTQRIGILSHSTAASKYDGYLAEFYYIDGQALDPTSFGEYDSVSGVWIPKAYAGTYGTNGFYITGADSADLGADYSGNGNDFTSSGLTTADQVTDTPTDNYPVISPIDRQSGASAPLKDGNLVFENNNTGTTVDARATFAVSSGKWYWEVEADALGQSGVAREFVGVVSPVWKIDSGSGGQSFYIDSTGYAYMTTGLKGNNNTTAAYGTAWTAGDIIGVALDLDNGKIWWSLNGTFQNSGDPAAGTGEAYSGLSGTYAPAFAVDYGTGTSRLIANFGQTGGLTYTPPTGFKALSAANLPEPTIKDGSAHFNTILYTGNGSATTRSLTGVGFQPDFVWKKIRSSADHHWLHDAVRGADKGLNSNRTDSEYTSTRLTSFDSDGFSFATSDPDTNGSGSTYVAWNWLAGNGTASNTDGSITSTVSANQTAGFSVVTYTGTGSAATVGHGLSTTPEMIIVKNRSASWGWFVYNSYLTNPTTGRLQLNLTNAEIAGGTPGPWNNTAPTSTVFSIGNSSFPEVNGSGDSIVAYCFAEVEGFSKFGKYTGNGSADGPFVWCGFRPAFILVKEYTSADDWLIYDSSRDPYNVAGRVLRPDSTVAEFDGRGGSRDVDFLSNGFKFRSSNATMNGSGAGYIFMEFAEHPFGGSGVAPVPAR